VEAAVKRTLAVVLVLALASTPGVPFEEDDLARGIAFVEEGDFQAAVVALDAAVRALKAQAAGRGDLARANVFLGVAYLELDQAVTARARFQDALALDPEMRLDADQFSAQVLRSFEAARLDMPRAPAPGPAPTPAPRAVPSAVAETPRKRRGAAPYLLLAGGGVVAGGVALAARGGEDGGAAGAASTTLAAGVVGGTTPATSPTSTTTTLPPATTPAPTTPTTTAPGTAPPAPTTTVPPPPPPAPAPSCSYGAAPGSQSFPASGGNGTCQVSAGGGCGWSAESTEGWVQITGGASGSGNGTISFRVSSNTEGRSRDARVRLRNTTGNTDARCEIEQSGSGLTAAAHLVWTGHLGVAGAEGQVVVDGAFGAFQERLGQHGVPVAPGTHRVEATLLGGDGRPGTWRFELAGTFEPGSLRAVAGEAAAVGPDTIVFRLRGRPGERVVFSVTTR
jgi:hypothetical protein